MIWYLSHPEVAIDPAVPVPDWGLSSTGRARAEALAATGWPHAPVTILTSPEAKARETAAIFARGVSVTVVPGSGEVDRSATGYVPRDRHETLADRLFAHPDESAAGWETARAAQARVVAALWPYLVRTAGEVLVVGHGGVGTLLWCHLAGRAIARTQDQPGCGHLWCARRDGSAILPVHPWRPMETPGVPGIGLDAPRRA